MTRLRAYSACLTNLQREQVQQLLGAHALKTRVFLADDCVRNAQFEFLQTHDLLFERSTGYESINIHNTFL